MIILYLPKYEDLWFRRELLADPYTMEYNHAYGGTISFPEEKWRDWYGKWILNTNGKRFYRYLVNEDNNELVGEIAYYFDEERQIYIANVIVKAEHRKNGFGKQGLYRLCEAAKENGIDILYDDIAIDNSAIMLFLDEGFEIESQNDEFVMVKKIL